MLSSSPQSLAAATQPRAGEAGGAYVVEHTCTACQAGGQRRPCCWSCHSYEHRCATGPRSYPYMATQRVDGEDGPDQLNCGVCGTRTQLRLRACPERMLPMPVHRCWAATSDASPWLQARLWCTRGCS